MEGYSKVKFYYRHEQDELNRVENMWATPEGLYYRLENIPFYVKNFSYRDLFSVKTISGDLFVNKLIEESGHSTIRILFYDKTLIQTTRQELEIIGCDSEVSDNPNLIAVDIPPNVDYVSTILPFLDAGEELDKWDFQEACISSIHRDFRPEAKNI